MNKDSYPVLLITGTIQVDSKMPLVAVKNINDRLNAYLDTIYWAIINSPFCSIVFCENSGYMLDIECYKKLASENHKKFEYITFTGNNQKILKQGKGYGEGEIIAYALNHSELLQGANYFCKLTGRTVIANADQCIREIRNYFMQVEGEKKMDTRYYCVKVSDYNKVLLRAYEEVDDEQGVYLEHVFYQKAKKEKLLYRSFYEMPWIKGVSGSTGLSYEDKRSLRTRKIINLFCRINIYNCRIIWIVIHKVSEVRIRIEKTGIKKNE